MFSAVDKANSHRQLIIKANFSTVSHKHVLNELKNLRLVERKRRHFPELVYAFIQDNHTFFVQNHRDHMLFHVIILLLRIIITASA